MKYFSNILTLLILCASCHRYSHSSPVTHPLAPDGDLSSIIPDYFDSKTKGKDFYKRKPKYIKEANRVIVSEEKTCGIDFRLDWSTVLQESAVYSTPIIYQTDTFSDKRDIIIASNRNYLEILKHDGSRPMGWPISFESSSFLSGPIVYDVDGDGHTDIGIVDSEANLYWVRMGGAGEYLEDFHVAIPKLRIRKDWLSTLNESASGAYVRISMFDRNYPFMDPTNSENSESNSKVSKGKKDILHVDESKSQVKEKDEEPIHRRLTEEPEPKDSFEAHFEETDSPPPDLDHLKDEDIGMIPDSMYGYGMELGDHGRRVHSADDGFSYYAGHRYAGSLVEDENFILTPAHVLATPSLVDLNDDGHMEVLFSVSYFFEQDEEIHGKDVDPSLYVASGLACWDMDTQDWTWTVHLDLSTAKSQ